MKIGTKVSQLSRRTSTKRRREHLCLDCWGREVLSLPPPEFCSFLGLSSGGQSLPTTRVCEVLSPPGLVPGVVQPSQYFWTMEYGLFFLVFQVSLFPGRKTFQRGAGEGRIRRTCRRRNDLGNLSLIIFQFQICSVPPISSRHAPPSLARRRPRVLPLLATAGKPSVNRRVVITHQGFVTPWAARDDHVSASGDVLVGVRWICVRLLQGICRLRRVWYTHHLRRCIIPTTALFLGVFLLLITDCI